MKVLGCPVAMAHSVRNSAAGVTVQHKHKSAVVGTAVTSTFLQWWVMIHHHDEIFRKLFNLECRLIPFLLFIV